MPTQLLALDYGQGEFYETPIREVSLIVSKEGYYPKNISVFKGEKVRFFLTSTTSTASCMIIREKEVFVSIKKGRITEAEALFKEPGKYKFYCPTGKITGHITVLEKPSSIRKREIASQRKRQRSKVRVWLPKEE